MALLETRGLTRRFPGVLALDHVDFAATRGEVYWLQQLDDRLSGRIGGGIEYIDPSSTDAPFIRYTAGLGLRYALLENADATLGWRFRMLNTRAATGDYTGNQFTLGVSLRL